MNSYLKIMAIVIVSSLMLACSDSKNANVTFSLKSDETVLSKAGAADTVIIDTAKFLISRLMFNGTGSADSLNVRTGPFVVIIHLDGTVTEIAAQNIPAGTYDHVKFELHKAAQNEDSPDPDFKTGPGGNERFSGIIIGRYNGARFVFNVQSTMNESINIDPPVVIADSVGVANVTLLVNPTLMFKQNGIYLDPTNTSAPNVAAIENSIKDAFKRALQDNNKDGSED